MKHNKLTNVNEYQPMLDSFVNNKEIEKQAYRALKSMIDQRNEIAKKQDVTSLDEKISSFESLILAFALLRSNVLELKIELTAQEKALNWYKWHYDEIVQNEQKKIEHKLKVV